MNSMHTIAAYRFPKSPALWVFDEPRFGLVQEPFVFAASEFLTAIVGEKCQKATLLFSENHFPQANVILARTWNGRNVDVAGSEYLARYLSGKNRMGMSAPFEKSVWLCPAMTHYFGKGVAPEFIYGQVVPAADASESSTPRSPSIPSAAPSACKPEPAGQNS